LDLPIDTHLSHPFFGKDNSMCNMFAVLVFALMLFHDCTGLHLQNNNNDDVVGPLSSSSSSSSRRRRILAGAASSLLLPSLVVDAAPVSVVPQPPPGFERVEGIGGGFDMLIDKPIADVDILYPPSLNGTWVCERQVTSVEGDTNQAQGAWKLLGGGPGEDFQKVEEKYYVRFVDLRRTTDGIMGLDGKKYYGDIFDRAYEMEERTGGAATVTRWDPRAPNILNYERDGVPATELKVVQRKVELQKDKNGWGSNELIRVTTKSNASLLFNFDIIYATRVQRRWRRSTTEEGDRVVEGLEIVKTYRVLDGIAGIETPTSTVKSKIRLTRTYPTRPK